jgi:hypothetical protein
VEDNGTTYGFRFDKLASYRRSIDEEAENMSFTNEKDATTTYPDFYGVSVQCKYNTGDSQWYVALAILTALFYLHEKSSNTADFCAVLPIKKRNTFAFKFGLLAIIAVAMLAVNVWSIYMYNARVPACNETYAILGLNDENMSVIGYNVPSLLLGLTEKLCTVSIFLFLAEVTNRAYLAPCIYILAVFAVMGTIAGLYSYADFYFNVSLHLRTNILRDIYYTDTSALIGAGILAVIAVLIGLWGLFLSGRGDLSRKGSIFRFKWVESIAMPCIVVCAVFCSFELMYLWELHYSVGAVASALIMLFVGAVAYFVSRRISLVLGR